MPGGLQDGGRRKQWMVNIHKSRRLRLFPWLEDNDHRVRLPVNCGAVIEDSVAKRNMICGCADGHKITVAFEVSVPCSRYGRKSGEGFHSRVRIIQSGET